MEANPKSDSALMEEKMMTLMEQTQGLLLQQQQATRATTSGGTSYNAAAYDIQVGQSVPPTSVPMSTGNVVTHQPIAGVRPVESLVVGTALLVGTVGPSDTTVECTLPKQSGSGQSSGGCGGRQGSRACYMSRGTDHLVAVCPVKAGLNQFIAQGGHAAPTGTTVDYYPTGLSPVMYQAMPGRREKDGCRKSVGNECAETVSGEVKVKEDIGEAVKSEKKNDKSKSVNEGAVNPREAVSVNDVDTDCAVSGVTKVEGVCRSPTKKPCCSEEQVDATKVDTAEPLEDEKICVESVLDSLSENAERALSNRVGSVTGADRVLE
ncbi:hypothetical protein PC116_g23119 [Phytophthora cactorum]|nr:hypothetical protein PC111_g20547 [Phytophthora cactorum]KAG4228532.1 hypothetical protein PC116_g23119 [Phytophthora cactorum]